jgi:hypothetical protein
MANGCFLGYFLRGAKSPRFGRELARSTSYGDAATCGTLLQYWVERSCTSCSIDQLIMTDQWVLLEQILVASWQRTTQYEFPGLETSRSRRHHEPHT